MSALSMVKSSAPRALCPPPQSSPCLQEATALHELEFLIPYVQCAFETSQCPKKTSCCLFDRDGVLFISAQAYTRTQHMSSYLLSLGRPTAGTVSPDSPPALGVLPSKSLHIRAKSTQ